MSSFKEAVSQMDAAVMAAFGEPFTCNDKTFTGTRDFAEVEHDAGFRIVSLLFVAKADISELQAGDVITFESGDTNTIRRVGKPVDSIVEVELAT